MTFSSYSTNGNLYISFANIAEDRLLKTRECKILEALSVVLDSTRPGSASALTLTFASTLLLSNPSLNGDDAMRAARLPKVWRDTDVDKGSQSLEERRPSTQQDYDAARL